MKITRILIAGALVLGGIGANAQLSLGGHFYGEDAFRYSQAKTSGSARMQALGGGYSALGADATNASTNPAGLGFYNRSELSITPIFNSLNTSSNYIGSTTNTKTSNANIGQLGLILSSGGTGTRKKRSSLAITYSKQANLLSDFSYAGQNKKSSMMDFFAEKATRRGVDSGTLDGEFNTNTGSAATSTAMYYQAFMIDPVSGSGAPYTKIEKSLPVNQTGRNSSTGAVSQWNIGYGANFDDKTYLGFSVGFVRMNYEYLGNHDEQFPTGKVFNGFQFNDDLSTRGGGINLSAGAIVKLTESISLGANVTSPTWITLNEIYNSSITVDQKPNTFTTDYKTVTTDENVFTYSLTTPLRASGGATFFLPSKKGFITADAEYVGYSKMGVKDPEDNSWGIDQKRVIQSYYKDAVNLKAGAEYRIENIRLRAGVKFMPDPYKQKVDNLDRSQMLLSGGVGYRSSKFFVDLAGVYNKFTSAYTPYELTNTANYASANLSSNQTSFVISVGTFF
ncbi:OmpP1/FadL family transporter [Emticicia sp. SJ17W-69]|uniref:OmpP1/FadL family transporter n=1 Tax=Emticicia sp. SJ17W-69 TaxID=3421657 RepID=UPI003EBF6244